MALNKVAFAFEYSGDGYFGPIYRPVAKVSFQSPIHKLWTQIWLVVDTGADFTILPRYVAADMAISLERDCIVDRTKGVGGEQAIYLYKERVKASLGSIIREIPLAFFSSDEIPALLGRLGFLETMHTHFLNTHRVEFLDS